MYLNIRMQAKNERIITLEVILPLLPGSVSTASSTCGKPNCACHHAPPRLHGPYRHWTRKIANKTVGKYLTKDQAHDAERWIENDRRIRELLARLEQIGIQRLDTDHT